MKKILLLLPLLALTGCGTLIPKTVEFFQKRVKAVPELPESAKETQRQAADYVATKTEETKIAAVESNASTNVVSLASDANTVASALSQSLGPPEDPWKKEAQRLALKLKEQQADYNKSLTKFSDNQDKVVGKKIEGTGLIRIPYFVYIGCIILVIFIAWSALKLYGAVNPVVGLGTNLAGRVSSAALSRGFSQVVAGAEEFKTAVAQSDFTAEMKAKILKMFQSHSRQEQDADIQEVVKTITK